MYVLVPLNKSCEQIPVQNHQSSTDVLLVSLSSTLNNNKTRTSV